MNHSTKIKNFNRNNAHATSMMSNMVDSFAKHGHVTTTLAKAKRLKMLLQADAVDKNISIVKLYRRKGDDAQMVKVMGERYVTKMNAPKTPKAKKEAKKTTAKSSKTTAKKTTKK